MSLTLRERLGIPRDIVMGAVESVRHELGKPFVIEEGLTYDRDDGDSFVMVTGPLWLNVTCTAIRITDATTGHWWCNHLAHYELRLMENYGNESTFYIGRENAKIYSLARGWEYPEYRDENGWA